MSFFVSLIPEMSNMEQTFLHTAISNVLPDLSEVAKDILEQHLQSLGVETHDDFQYIEEADLARKVIAAWKLRCKSHSES